MNQKTVRTTAAFGILLLAVSPSARGADHCAEWQKGFAAYEDEVEKAIQDEPEDLPRELRRHAEAIASGNNDYAERIEKKIRGGLTGLQAIDPDPDMTRFHADLIACYRNGVAVLDAEQRGDGPGRQEAEIRTWESFRRMFTTVRDLLVERECSPGDVAAIDQDYLPHIDAEIEALKSGTSLKP